MTIRIVQSRQNPRVKELRAALLRPARGSGDPIGLEGLHLVQEALQSGLHLTTVFVAQSPDSSHESLLDSLSIPSSAEILALPAEILASAVTTEAPQPIAALAQPPSWTWQQILAPNTLLVVLAGLQDPGNLGSILRSAEAFGASGVIALPGTVSPWNPKAMRASAGSVFRLPLLHATEDDCFARLRAARIQTIAAMPHQASPLAEHALHYPTALVIGSEGPGIPPSIADRCTARVTIPTPGPVESLNAAVAASVLLYEASRQRSLAGKGSAS